MSLSLFSLSLSAYLSLSYSQNENKWLSHGARVHATPDAKARGTKVMVKINKFTFHLDPNKKIRFLLDVKMHTQLSVRDGYEHNRRIFVDLEYFYDFHINNAHEIDIHVRVYGIPTHINRRL